MENRLDPTPHLERFDSYEQAYQHFRWVIPKRFNIAREICRRHADAVTRIALSDVKEDGGINTYTFGGLDFLSDKFATALSHAGIRHGDSVAIALPSSAALIIAHLGALKAGAVVAPLSPACDAALFELALGDGNARTLVIHESDWAKVEGVAQKLPGLDSRFIVGNHRLTVVSSTIKYFWAEIDRASSQFEAVETDASSAAFVFYSVLQGEITGIVHSHRSAIAQLAAFELLDSKRGRAGDWSSPIALLGLLYPSLWYGCSVVAAASAEEVQLTEVYGKPETGWIIGKCDRWFTTPTGSIGRCVPGRLVDIIDKTGKVVPCEQQGLIAVHKSDPALFIEYHHGADKTAASFIGDWFLTGDIGYKKENGDFYIER